MKSLQIITSRMMIIIVNSIQVEKKKILSTSYYPQGPFTRKGGDSTKLKHCRLCNNQRRKRQKSNLATEI